MYHEEESQSTVWDEKEPVFSASGLPKGNSHEPVNPPITPLSGLPGALQLANPGHGDARPGQAVEDAVVGLGESYEQQEREERFRGHCSSREEEPQTCGGSRWWHWKNACSSEA